MGKIFDWATNPHQYDLAEISWVTKGVGLELPTRAHFWEYLAPHLSNVRNKDILEIGPGTGWLLDLVYKAGAKLVIGIDPSTKMIELKKKYYPQVTIITTTLENFSTNKRFDVILAILSFGHFPNLEAAFQKISSLLKPKGELLIIVPDFDYFRRPRFGYKIGFEKINGGSYATLVERTNGIIADIVYKVSKYRDAGRRANLILFEDIPMPPTERLMEKAPRYKQFKGVIMTRLLRFSVAK